MLMGSASVTLYLESMIARHWSLYSPISTYLLPTNGSPFILNDYEFFYCGGVGEKQVKSSYFKSSLFDPS